MNERSFLETSVDVLKIAKKRTVKTRIIQKLNLNFKIAEVHLDYLRSLGFITGPVGSENKFLTTDRSVNYVHQFKYLKSRLEEPYFRPSHIHGRGKKP